jgi:hypothetical protein
MLPEIFLKVSPPDDKPLSKSTTFAPRVLFKVLTVIAADGFGAGAPGSGIAGPGVGASTRFVEVHI